MTYNDVINELKGSGTAQTRKIYARHGVEGKMFGVSYANLTKLKKRIKQDQPLAARLWSTGNHDARILATMVADPDGLDSKTVEAWVRDLDNYIVTDAFAGLVARSPLALKKMEKWSKSKNEFVAQTGWQLRSWAAMKADDLPDAYFDECLKTIETNIHKSKNRVRHSMNGALISIGLRNAKLEKKAVAAAKRIGKVEVDHGDTSCTTPDAVAYIKKAKAYFAKKKKK